MYNPPSEEHSVEVLFEDPLVVVTGPNNPLARRRKIEFAELLDEPWTLQPRENSFGAFAMDAFRAAGLAPPRITVATTSSNLRGEMLATGHYLTMVPRYWILLPRRHPSLKVLPVEFPNTRLKVAIITLRNRSLSRATELFIDSVRALTKPRREKNDAVRVRQFNICRHTETSPHEPFRSGDRAVLTLPTIPSRSPHRSPMSRRALTFVCQNCGAVYGRWQGKCDSCGEWNTVAEETGALPAAAGPGKPHRKGRPFVLHPLAGTADDAPRTPCGLAELDRVTGGGFVRGSVLLVGGDPGIGKSTLLIQAAAAIARAGHRAVYISGEEAVAQVRLRAARLGLAQATVELAAETAVEDIVATLSDGKTPRLVVVDSIQTMWTDSVESAPGTVSQVRGAAQILIRYAKRSGATVILVGHVTKDGQIAGPRVVEHMVDAVLSFEGEGAHLFASCAPSRTVSAPPTRSACSR